MCSTWAEEPFSTKTLPFQIGLGLGRSFENYVLPSFCPETIHLSIVSTSEQVVLKSFVKETFKTARSSADLKFVATVATGGRVKFLSAV